MNARFLSGCILLMVFALSLHVPSLHAEDDPGRLDPAVVPLAQSIELWLDPAVSDYRGQTTIELSIAEPTELIRIHARGPEVHTATLATGGESFSLETSDAGHELIGLNAGRTIPAGKATLELSFDSQGGSKAAGLYRVNYEDHWYYFTQFEAIDARAAFPCFDEPRFKLPWTLSLAVPKGEEVIANTPEIGREERDGNWVMHRFAATPPLPSYLVAIAAGPLDFVDLPGMGVPGRVVVPRGKAQFTGEVLAQVPPILRALEEYFGQPYPFAKLDIVAVPEFWPGAMENPGLITYRDTLLLLDPGGTTLAQRKAAAYVHAHELAHQWFGNLVTMEWWDDLWLNESFATWLGGKIVGNVYPDFGQDISARKSALRVMDQDAQMVARAIRQPMRSDMNLMTAADGLTYQKGASVLGMFEAFIGEDAFRDGVRNYLKAHEWDNAVAADLFAQLSASAEIDLAPALSSFLDQAGVPVVSAIPIGDGKVELSQRRYVREGSEAPAQQWEIPVVLRSWSGGEAKETKVWLREPTTVVELSGGEPELLLPDSGARGYYRWELPDAMLDQLVKEADSRLSSAERVDLVSQVDAAMEAGQLDGGRWLAHAERMLDDEEAEVVGSAVGILQTVKGAFVDEEMEPAYFAWVRASLTPLLSRWGLSPQPGEDEQITLLRPRLVRLLGEAGNEEIHAAAAEALQTKLADGMVEPGLEQALINLAVRDGDWKLWNQISKEVEAAEQPNERRLWLSALSRFQDPAIANASLRFALGDKLRPTEFFTVPMGVARSHPYDNLVWDWFSSNYDTISGKMPEMMRAFLPFFGRSCELEKLERAEAFFADPAHQAPGYEKQFNQMAESTRDCARLRSREMAAVKAHLERYQADPPGR